MGNNLAFLFFRSNDIPTYVLAEEAQNNPQMLALLINLLDLDSDGYIAPEEVARFRDAKH